MALIERNVDSEVESVGNTSEVEDNIELLSIIKLMLDKLAIIPMFQVRKLMLILLVRNLFYRTK